MCYDIEHFSTPVRNCYFGSLRNWNVNLIGVILQVLKVTYNCRLKHAIINYLRLIKVLVAISLVKIYTNKKNVRIELHVFLNSTAYKINSNYEYVYIEYNKINI